MLAFGVIFSEFQTESDDYHLRRGHAATQADQFLFHVHGLNLAILSLGMAALDKRRASDQPSRAIYDGPVARLNRNAGKFRERSRRGPGTGTVHGGLSTQAPPREPASVCASA